MISIGCDLGRSGKTVITAIEGEKFKLRLVQSLIVSSISAPEVESMLANVHATIGGQIVLVESTGPGGVFADYIAKNRPGIPIYTVDTSLPAIDLALWNDIVLTEKEFSNIRAEMFWIVRLLFRDQRISLPSEDPELFAQLSSMRWDLDKSRGERIRIEPKKYMKISYAASELEGYSASRSPDKADALALAVLGYTFLAQNEGKENVVDEIIEPEVDGFFPIGALSEEV